MNNLKGFIEQLMQEVVSTMSELQAQVADADRKYIYQQGRQSVCEAVIKHLGESNGQSSELPSQPAGTPTKKGSGTTK